MPRPPRISDGIVTGLVAAAATSGALVGFGLRFGTPARPFNAIAAVMLGYRAQGILGFSAIATVWGLVVHVAVVMLAGVLFIALVARTDGHVALWAVVLAVVYYLMSWMTGAVLGVGLSTLLAVGDRLVLTLVLAIALPAGMRIAFFRAARE